MRKLRALGATAVAVVLSSLLLSSVAQAADSVYWTNHGTPDAISFAGLAGGGGGDLPITASTLSNPRGVAINPATNKIYWANETNNTIAVANLDGSGAAVLPTTGATLSGPRGVAINPATNKIYWANNTNNTIGFANLDGSGAGGQLSTTGATLSGPWGVAIDPAANKIYWANETNNTIGFANLDGSGAGGQLPIGAGFLAAPAGLAIDKATGQIFWANGNSIGFANLSGSNGGLLVTTGATLGTPEGVAVDPVAGKVYWGKESGTSISFANVNNTGGGGDVVSTGATTSSPSFPALLKAPVGTGAPAITATGSAPGATLSCTQGTWEADLLGSFLFHAPQAFATQWLSNGQPVLGASTSSVVPTGVGNYSCQVSAKNAAGSTAQTSTTVALFKLGKASLKKKKGTALLTVTVPGAGSLKLTGKSLVKRTAKRTATTKGNVKLTVKAKGKKLKKLKANGKVKVKAKITFTPASGTGGTQTKSLTLRKKLR